MQTTLVYRLSCHHKLCIKFTSKYGVSLFSGPYVPHHPLCWWSKIRNTTPLNYTMHTDCKSRRPGPSTDIPGWDGYAVGNFLFGFTSVESFSSWFPVFTEQESRHLTMHTYLVDSNSVIPGKRQAIFRWDDVVEELC